MNCNSIQGKTSSIRAATNMDPDVIMGTESKLGQSIGNAEVFPFLGYIIHRKDRKHGGGGVFLAIKDCYPSSSLESPGDSEQVWARVSLKGSKHMYIGSFYRPPNKTHEPFTHLSDMLQNINECPRDKLKTLGGDFNCKDIIKLGQPCSGIGK